MLRNRYYVYILSNTSRMLYIGMTGNFDKRIRQHRQKMIDGFTKQYNLHQLIYYEQYQDVNKAIAREKELKGWRREKKVQLIEKKNPGWDDLAKDES